MKKLPFILALGLLALTASAQIPKTSSLWDEKTMTLPRESGKEVTKEQLALTQSGELYAAGKFAESFTFAGTTLEPVAGSSYLLKYDNQGNPKWGVAIQGAVTITAIATDETGGVYLAGVFASEIALGSTTGAPTNITGVEGEELNSAFVAKYSAEGVLQHHSAFVPRATGTGELMAFDTPSFTINKLLIRNGKLYAVATNVGADVQSGAVSLSGTYMNYENFMASFLRKTHVLELNAECAAQRVIYTAGADPGVTTLSHAYSPSIAFDANGKLYVGIVGSGKISIEIGTQKENKEFFVGQDGTFGHNFVLTSIALTDLSYTTKSYETKHQKEYNRCLISNLEVTNGTLVVFGTFNDSLAFRPALKPSAANDAFIAQLDKETLTEQKSIASGIREGDDMNKVAESVHGSFLLNDIAGVIITTDSTSTGKRNTGHLTMDYIGTTTESISNVNAATDKFFTGISTLGNKVALATVNRKTKTIAYQVFEWTAASLKATKHLSVTATPTITPDKVTLSEVCDVQVISLSGELMATQAQTNIVDLTPFDAGVYLLRIAHDKGTGVVRVVKK